MGDPVIHFEVVGRDGAKLQQFYGDVFGWKIDASNPMKYGIVDNGGEGINGGVGEADEPASDLLRRGRRPRCLAPQDRGGGRRDGDAADRDPRDGDVRPLLRSRGERLRARQERLLAGGGLRYADAPRGHPRAGRRDRARRAALHAAPRRSRRRGRQARAARRRRRHARLGHDRRRALERLRLGEPRQAERRARRQGSRLPARARAPRRRERRLPAELHARVGRAGRPGRAVRAGDPPGRRLRRDLRLRARRAVRRAERLRPRHAGRDGPHVADGDTREPGARRPLGLRRRSRVVRGRRGARGPRPARRERRGRPRLGLALRRDGRLARVLPAPLVAPRRAAGANRPPPPALLPVRPVSGR